MVTPFASTVTTCFSLATTSFSFPVFVLLKPSRNINNVERTSTLLREDELRGNIIFSLQENWSFQTRLWSQATCRRDELLNHSDKPRLRASCSAGVVVKPRQDSVLKE